MRAAGGTRIGRVAFALALALALAGCSGGGGTGPDDTTAPTAVTSLACGNPTSVSVRLTWTAPGDDGFTGTATAYDVRYLAGAAIDEATWASASVVTSVAAPRAAGSSEALIVDGLAPSTTYYFALKARDEASNWSAISNVCSSTTHTPADVTPPAAVTDLAASNPTASTVDLAWTAPGDDAASGSAAQYDVRYSTSPITAGTWAAATQATGEPVPQAAGQPETFTVTGLAPSTAYYFALRAADEVPNWSGLSNVPSRATAAAASFVFALAWGGAGSADGEFTTPFGIAVDGGGNVYVADAENHRIQKFTSSGGFLTSWGSQGSGDSQFAYPYGVATDNSANVYVSDALNGVVKKFTSSGGFLARIGAPLSFPHAVAVDNSGAIYVVEATAGRVKKFSSAGSLVAQWGSSGAADGQLNGPQGIAVDASGSVYVADTGNDRIQKFSSGGAFLAKWGTTGAAAGEFDQPRGLAADGAGRILVADSQNSRIQVFTSGGAFLGAWGSAGTAQGQFEIPSGVAVGPLGSVYVTDTGNNRIQQFSPGP